MTLRIDARWPLVWRDPFTIQVGIDPPRVILENLGALEEKLVSALAIGVTRSGLGVIADGQSGAVDALLDRLAPVLQHPSPRSAGTSIAMSGSGRFVDLASRLLGEAGMKVLVADSPSRLTDAAPDLAIVVGHGVFAPPSHSVWLRRDVPHVPVLFTDSAVHLGPVIEPGAGPCLICIELHRQDRDAAWPVIATQLLTRAPAQEPPALATEAAAALCRLVIERLETGPGAAHSLRIATGGDRSAMTWVPHPECGCRGLTSTGTGSDSASAPCAHRQNSLPTTAPGGSELA